MKVSAAALAVILIATALCAPASASPYSSDTTPCCFAYIARPLPRAHIKEYFYTSGKCSNPAVVHRSRMPKREGQQVWQDFLYDSRLNKGKLCHPKEPPSVCQPREEMGSGVHQLFGDELGWRVLEPELTQICLFMLALVLAWEASPHYPTPPAP
ncbi:C-C motif chemokine 5 isoform X3 [Gorilla gorilla gorilla]|uniref:C-C motif chemokine 5 isoform X3 n=1 Tax=Gorilla gorilla gorilla TaxID=9595 RepID=UPI00123E7374|nr:C-C motif chemokine 5 isoform X3 [Gorilla gorilla gorilla]